MTSVFLGSRDGNQTTLDQMDPCVSRQTIVFPPYYRVAREQLDQIETREQDRVRPRRIICL